LLYPEVSGLKILKSMRTTLSPLGKLDKWSHVCNMDLFLAFGGGGGGGWDDVKFKEKRCVNWSFPLF